VSDLIQEWADEADKPISDSITADLHHFGAEPSAAG
jgi:hypothetical protein